MTNLREFFSTHPVHERQGDFQPDELATLSQQFPTKAVALLNMIGRASFHCGFLRTVLPGDLDFGSIFRQWGMSGRNHPFLCTAFGALVFYKLGQGFYYLNPIVGEVVYMGFNLNRVCNKYLASADLLIADLYSDVFFSSRAHTIGLRPNEVFSLPANYDRKTASFPHPPPICDIHELHLRLSTDHFHQVRRGDRSFSSERLTKARH